MRKLMIMLLAAGFVGTVAFAEKARKNKCKKVKKELTEEQKAKRAARKKKHMEMLKKAYPDEMAQYEKLIADGKKKEARKVLSGIYKQRAIARLDKFAEKYPDQVAEIKKLMEDKSKEGRKALRDANKALWKQVKEDRMAEKKARKGKKKKGKKAKKAE